MNPATYGNAERKRLLEQEKEDVVDKVAEEVIARMGNKQPKKAKKSKGPFCKFYNKGDCPNAPLPYGNGCEGPNKVKYEHSCDARVQGGRVCGRKDHKALTCPAKKD